jgi:dTDP-glucose 4,6-dehydratase
MRTILVAGGAGFIGCNFVRTALARTEWRVIVYDKMTYAGNPLNLHDLKGNPRFELVPGDITDAAQLAQELNRNYPDVIINFAAESHVDRSIDGPRAFLKANVVGAFELLESARLYYADLTPVRRRDFRFLQVSTDEVYGSLGATGKFAETSQYAPNSPYAASKAAADHFVRSYHGTYGLPALVTNCSNNYGPYQFPEKLIPLTILNALEGKPLPLYGDGSNVRDWLFVEEHCEGLLTVLRYGRPGAKYNMGGNSELSNIEVVSAVCSVLDDLIPTGSNPALAGRGLKRYADLITFVADRLGHDHRYAIDCSFIGQDLGWTPKVSFSAGIRRTVAWYLDNLAWCRGVKRGKYDGQRLGLAASRELQ